MEELSKDWFLIPFLFNLVLLAFVKHNYKEYIQAILLSTISYGTSSKIYRENKNVKARSAFLLNLIFLISIGIFILQIIIIYFPSLLKVNTLLIIGIAIITIIVIILLNKFINYISGFIFLNLDISSEYNHNIDFFNHALGLILFPVTVLISLSDIPKVAAILGIIAFCLIYLLRIIRLIKINFNKQLNYFYMFLYLCTVEILPILILIKTLIIF